MKITLSVCFTESQLNAALESFNKMRGKNLNHNDKTPYSFEIQPDQLSARLETDDKQIIAAQKIAITPEFHVNNSDKA